MLISERLLTTFIFIEHAFEFLNLTQKSGIKSQPGKMMRSWKYILSLDWSARIKGTEGVREYSTMSGHWSQEKKKGYEEWFCHLLVWANYINWSSLGFSAGPLVLCCSWCLARMFSIWKLLKECFECQTSTFMYLMSISHWVPSSNVKLF